MSWAKDSKRLVTASADQTVRVWDVEADKCLHSWRIGDEGAVSVSDQQVGVLWPHGRSDGLIISLSLNGDLNYLTEGSSAPTKIVQGHNKSITALGVGSDRKSVITGSFDGRVCSWDINSGTGSVVDGQAHANQVKQFASVPGRTYSVAWDDTLRTIDESANTFTGSSVKLNSQPQSVAAAADGHVIVAHNNGIAVYSKDQLVSELRTDFTPAAVAAHGSFVAVGGPDDNSVLVYTLDGGGKLSSAPTATLRSSTAKVVTLSFSPNGKHLAAGNSSGKIVVYSTGSWDVATDRWSAHTARVLSIAWNEAGTHAASGGLDTNVFVWSLSKPGSRVKAANAHKDGVYGVAWLEGGRKVVSSGGDAAIKIWTVNGLQ